MGYGQDVTLDHEWGRTDPPFVEFGRSPKSPNQSPFLSSIGEKKVGMEDGHWAAGGAPLFRKFLSPTSVCHIFPDFFPFAIPSTCDSVCQLKSRGPYFFLRQSFPRTAPSSAVPIFGKVERMYVHTTEYSYKNIPFFTGKCFNLLKEGTPYASFSQHTCPWQLLR